ncbi:MAG TPA: hypothetical protein VFV69_08370 [Steroidobacteraceae bacterium]|jgi:hypothetical protein|nr:hypothetical protein [Steroidobacteraceae bacterium]
MWRRLRIAVLLLILTFVALNTYFDRVYSTDWDIPLRVAVFPINADGSAVSEHYIRELSADSFAEIEAFFEQEAHDYGLQMERPVRLTLASPLAQSPPVLAPDPGMLSAAWWSLRMRFWAWRVDAPPGPAPDIKLFVLYHDPAISPAVPHSLGVQKGLFGVVHVFADAGMHGSNETVMAHELLHTLGATDKYDLRTNQPTQPDGYAEPDLDPLYPQSFAELMGGRIPESAATSRIPESLQQVIVGVKTASEIGWSKR